MLDDNILNITSLVVSGFAFGLSLGFVSWFLSWCYSQIIHFFKVISR